MKLPPLQGSDKQISWAEAIRSKQITAWQSCSAIYDAIEKDLYGKKLASWWIANKDKNANEIYRFIKSGSVEKMPSSSKTVIKKLVTNDTINSEGAVKVETDYGYKTIFPTRSIDNGEIVNDDSVLF